MIDWNAIRHVLLDMDGTLLDLHFDNHFWLEYLPRHYAERHQLATDAAAAKLMAMYREVEGTLAWYSVDYWSERLEVDIMELKQETAHLIAEHANARLFMRALRKSGHRVVLVTNAHPKALGIKLARTGIGEDLDNIISAHDLGAPKEHPDFWRELHVHEPHDPARTLFIDDNVSILRTAQQAGIGHLLCIATPDTRRPARSGGEFHYLQDFAHIIPSASLG